MSPYRVRQALDQARPSGPASPVPGRVRRTLTRKFLEREYLRAGQSVTKVATLAGVGDQAVYQALRRHGIALERRGYQPSRWSWGDVLSREYLDTDYRRNGRSARDNATEHAAAPSPFSAGSGSTVFPGAGRAADMRRGYDGVLTVDLLTQVAQGHLQVSEAAGLAGTDLVRKWMRELGLGSERVRVELTLELLRAWYVARG